MGQEDDPDDPLVIISPLKKVILGEPYFQTPYAEDDKGRKMSMRSSRRMMLLTLRH